MDFLREHIRQNPLTPESISRFVSEQMRYLYFLDIPQYGGWFKEASTKGGKYNITVNPIFGFEEALITLAHETAHIFFKSQEYHAYILGITLEQIREYFFHPSGCQND